MPTNATLLRAAALALLALLALLAAGAWLMLSRGGAGRRRACAGAGPAPAPTGATGPAPARVLKLEEAVLAARAQGAGENEIYRMRSSALSPAAAARLAELDHAEADWSRRISQYQAERQQWAASDGAALQQLRDTLFTTDEQKRLGAYE